MEWVPKVVGYVPKVVGSLLIFFIAALTSVALSVPENLPKQLLVAAVWYLAGAMTAILIARKTRTRLLGELSGAGHEQGI